MGSLKARVQRRFLGVEKTEVVKHTKQLTPCLLAIIDGRLPTGSTNFAHDSVEVASRAMHERHL